MSERARALSTAGRLALAARIFLTFARVSLLVRRRPLPEIIGSLGRVSTVARRRHEPRALGIAVHRCLGRRPLRARCLFQSLVLYRLLREQGEPAEIAIGLPSAASDERAHSWVEIDGVVVGPPPGRMRHEALARFA